MINNIMAQEINTVKIDELATSSLKSSDYFIKGEGSLMYKNTLSALSNFIGSVGEMGYRGALSATDTPTEDGFYFASESGTYANAGGLVVDLDEGINIISILDAQTTFDKVVVPVDLSGQLENSVEESNTTKGVTGKGVFDYVTEEKSEWFINKYNIELFEKEVIMLQAIKYFYSTSDNYILAQFGKGETTYGNSIVLRRISDNAVFVIYRGYDTGRNVYHQIVSGENVVIDVDWDAIPDLSTFYLSTATPRFAPTQIPKDRYKNLLGMKYNSYNVPVNNRFVFKDDEIEFRGTDASTIELSKNIVIPNEKISLKFKVDTLRENGVTLGYVDVANSRRFLFGYEPAFDAVVFYVEDAGFVQLVEGKEMLNDGYIELGVEYRDGEIIGYYNRRTFIASDYTAHDTSLVSQRRMNLKVKNSDFSVIDSFYQKTNPESSIFKKVGSGVYVYRTGLSNGDLNYNDWSFVRTPKNYDPNRQKPYPFVIVNHGNSWIMDGTVEKANFAAQTQFGVDTQNNGAYLDTDAPYYKEFSNETMERLLEAGYVVCGTQNYGNAEYGSDRGRNALQAYFYHMKENWNVEEKCFMIGVSNGVMMSLNGAFLLGIENIKAIWGMYPLACLFRHYKGYVPHQAAIESIYGLTGSETDEQLHAAFSDHDPEYANTIEVAGLRYKCKLFPPMMISYSMDDTITDANNNAIPLIEMIQRSNGKVEYFIATGQHGNFTHFDPAGTVNFFNKFL